MPRVSTKGEIVKVVRESCKWLFDDCYARLFGGRSAGFDDFGVSQKVHKPVAKRGKKGNVEKRKEMPENAYPKPITISGLYRESWDQKAKREIGNGLEVQFLGNEEGKVE